MDTLPRIDTFAPYAAFAVLLAGAAWIAVGKAANREPGGSNTRALHDRLVAAGYLTGIACFLGLLAYMTR